MLKRLLIQNYAIIDEIDILFSSKLNIITGETGAGKSILVGALSLILGNRADTAVLLNK
jgi:DNA repair protein RecN (Recombination protein N)